MEEKEKNFNSSLNVLEKTDLNIKSEESLIKENEENQENYYIENWKLFNLEKAFLKACLQKQEIFLLFEKEIKKFYFLDSNIYEIFKIFQSYFRVYSSLPKKEITKSIIKKLNKNNEEELLSIVEEIYSSRILEEDEIKYIYDEILLFIKNNKLKSAILKSMDFIKKNNFIGIQKIIEEAISWNPSIEIGVNLIEVEKRYKELEIFYKDFIPSPWEDLNFHIGGGFFRKELISFISNSSVGKSIALDQCGLHAWLKGFNVVLISLEMSELRKCQRIDSCLLEIFMSDLIERKNEVFNFYKNLNLKNKFYIKEFPTASITIYDIKKYLYYLQVYEKLNPQDLDLIIVDYGDLLLPAKNSSENEYHAQGKVFEELRALAQEYNVAVLTATQFHREAINLKIEDISEKNIGDSIKKMRIVDTLIALHNTPEERASGILNMKLLKNRNGAKDVILNKRINYEFLKIF